MDTSRADILKMVQDGQLSAAEAAAKLKKAPAHQESSGRMLRVRVMDLDTGRPQVNVNLPIRWVQVGLSIGARFAPELNDLDWQTIVDALQSEKAGQIVQVEDLEGGKRVEVYVE